MIVCEPSIQKQFDNLLDWMYEKIYRGIMQKDDLRAEYTIDVLFDLLYEHENLRNSFNKFRLSKNPEDSLATFIKDIIVLSKETYIREFFRNCILA